jgi:hypothetical protein
MVAIPLLARLQTPVTIVTLLSRAAKPYLVSLHVTGTNATCIFRLGIHVMVKNTKHLSMAILLAKAALNTVG